MISSLVARRAIIKSDKLLSTAVFNSSRYNATSSSLRFLSSVSPPPSFNDKQEDNKINALEQQRKIHNTSRKNKAAADAASFAAASIAETPETKTTTKEEDSSFLSAFSNNALLHRFVTTAEVTVSKIFPAGFGWQTSSIIAENNLGFTSDTMAFAYTTGFGDAVGVMAGHTLFYAAKKAFVDKQIDMTKEVHTGVLLASAAFCSGTVWQPLVNALQGANLSFVEVFTGTWLGCGTAFYLGLRGARSILSGYMEHVHEPTYANSKNDLTLSVSIGGATGFFVGTDAAYLPDENFLINVVGITDNCPNDLTGCAIAGTSTALGFVTSQSAYNMIYPAGKLWTDK